MNSDGDLDEVFIEAGGILGGAIAHLVASCYQFMDLTIFQILTYTKALSSFRPEHRSSTISFLHLVLSWGSLSKLFHV